MRRKELLHKGKVIFGTVISGEPVRLFFFLFIGNRKATLYSLKKVL
jgi:hypothetical protein